MAPPRKIIIKFYRRYIRSIGYTKYLSRYLFRLIQFAIYSLVTVLVIDVLALVTGNASELGVFGDFIGGTLNPIFTMLTLVGLIVTIVLQKKELSLARIEFARTADSLSDQNKNIEIQRFENTFFNLLDYYENCRDDVRTQSGSKALVGRDAIEQIFKVFLNSYLMKTEIAPGNFMPTSRTVFRQGAKTKDGIISIYSEFYNREYGSELGQYFRAIYQILKFIDGSSTIENKKFYSNLIRSQLSRYELIMLYYNCLSEYGNDKMLKLVMKYEIMKHLELGMLPENHSEFYSGFSIHT